MSLHHIQLSSWESSTRCRLLREPERPEDLRQSTFEDEFDYTTLAYDLFTDNDGAMRMLCPPRDDFLRHLTEMEFHETGCARKLDYSVEVVDRVSYLNFSRNVASIEGIHDFGRVTLTNQPNLSRIFADRNAVFTMQKNNKLEWLADWAYFYVSYHAANAFLVYDNASDDYDLCDVYEAINQVAEGLEVIVIDWPFKYGPAPTSPGDFKAVWSQRVALNHARLRFFGSVGGALNIDIDEYVWCGDGGSLFARFRNSGQDFMKINGYKGLMSVKHDNSSIRHVNKLGNRDREKWICSGAMTRQTYWQPHTVKFGEKDPGETPPELATFDPEDALYFHLRGLRTVKTNRKMRKPKKDIPPWITKARKRKAALLGGLKSVLSALRISQKPTSGNSTTRDSAKELPREFAERPRIKPIFDRFVIAVREMRTPMPGDARPPNPLQARIWAGELFRNGDLRAAQARIEELIRMDGNRKSYSRLLKLVKQEMRDDSSA